MLPYNVSVRNSVCNPDKPTIKCVRKSINLLVLVLFFQVNPFVIVMFVQVNSLMLVCSSKPIHGSNFHLSKPITSNIACPNKLVSGSNVCYIKPVSSVSSICPSK